MSHPIPAGTRDILPDEMRELRKLSGSLLAAFEKFGYGEVWTPTMEYEDVLVQGDERAAGASYRLFDENGQVLALRSDMTIPIARMVATRFADRQPPFRFCYLSHAYRAVTPQRGQQREFLQAGVELVGAEAPEGTVEVLEVLCDGLDAASLERARVGVGDAGLYPALLEALAVPADRRPPLLAALARHDFVELEQLAGELALAGGDARNPAATLAQVPQLRGDIAVIDRAIELGGQPVAQAARRLREVAARARERGIVDRLIFDRGLVRDLGYYTGAIFEVYDPALGHVLGGGGRYDDLLARFGAPMPACGFALYVERLHVAQAEEERRNAGGGKVGDV
jgi:ATP phosphoribosyltransferase regulatory subunit